MAATTGSPRSAASRSPASCRSQAPSSPTFRKSWLGYIAVDDVDARSKKATAAGGKVMREPFDIAGVGRIAILMDSRGVAIGLMTPTN